MNLVIHAQQDGDVDTTPATMQGSGLAADREDR